MNPRKSTFVHIANGGVSPQSHPDVEYRSGDPFSPWPLRFLLSFELCTWSFGPPPIRPLPSCTVTSRHICCSNRPRSRRRPSSSNLLHSPTNPILLTTASKPPTAFPLKRNTHHAFPPISLANHLRQWHFERDSAHYGLKSSTHV
jgi:hypothetical protein